MGHSQKEKLYPRRLRTATAMFTRPKRGAVTQSCWRHFDIYHRPVVRRTDSCSILSCCICVYVIRDVSLLLIALAVFVLQNLLKTRLLYAFRSSVADSEVRQSDSIL
jgi:hypothetical protein